MRLPSFLCKRFHIREYWQYRTSHNKKDPGKTFKPAFWCFRCKVFRYMYYEFCKQCNLYMLPKHIHYKTEETNNASNH